MSPAHTRRAAPVGPAPTRTAYALGVAGLLPFVAGALAAWTLPGALQPGIVHALGAYGAAILAFLGGLHWGLAARGTRASWQYAWGIVPSLVAWGALLLPPRVGLAVLAAALLACYAVDRRVFPAEGLAAWLPMRAALTAVAAASCVVGAFAVA